jgi:hypothetical protein
MRLCRGRRGERVLSPAGLERGGRNAQDAEGDRLHHFDGADRKLPCDLVAATDVARCFHDVPPIRCGNRSKRSSATPSI